MAGAPAAARTAVLEADIAAVAAVGVRTAVAVAVEVTSINTDNEDS